MDYEEYEELERRLERAKEEARRPLYEKHPRAVYAIYLITGTVLMGIVLWLIYYLTKGG